MTQMERTILQVLVDLGTATAELGKSHNQLANFVHQNLPDVPEEEKANLLAVAEKSWQQMQQLQDRVERLKAVL